MVFKAIADWIVMLYIFVPSAAIFFVIYRSWWEENPQWLASIPFLAVYALLFLFIWNDHFRTFVTEADRIFLIKNRRIFIGLKRHGILYSYAVQVIYALFFGFLIAPFWLNEYQLGLEQLALYLGLFLSSKWLVMGIRGKLNVHLHGWRSVLRSVPVIVGVAIIWIVFYYFFQTNQVFLMVGLLLFNTLCSIFLIKSRFNMVETFEQDLAIDELEKSKYVNMIFGISMEVEKPKKPSSPRNKPILYPTSNRLFRTRSPKNGFLELFIKVTTRNTEYLLRYLQMIGITLFALILIPVFWYKLIIIIFGFFFVRLWISYTWDSVVGEHVFTMKYAEKDAYVAGKKIVTMILTLLFFIFIGLSFVIRGLIFMWV